MPEHVKTKKELLIHESLLPKNLPDMNTTIAELAYYKSQSRGFEPGHELEDWLQAEREFLYSQKVNYI